MNKIIATFAVVLTLSAGNLFADDGQVTDLDAFGLSSMQVVSDVQGMEVRGMARARTSGYSGSYIFLTNNIGTDDYHDHSAKTKKFGRNGGSSNSSASVKITLPSAAFGLPQGTSKLSFKSGGGSRAYSRP
jgi:hypothetical protein